MLVADSWVGIQDNHRIRVIPKNVPPRHNDTLNTTFQIASEYHPPIINSMVSRENVENVVKPPSKPTKNINRHNSFSATRSIRAMDRHQMMNEPNTLTARIPYGNPDPSKVCNPCTIANLSTAPTAPPTATAVNAWMEFRTVAYLRVVWSMISVPSGTTKSNRLSSISGFRR